MGRFFFFFREALRALRRSAAPSIAATVTIVVTVLLLGVLVPVLWTTQGKAEDVREQIGMRVFLFDDASKVEIDNAPAARSRRSRTSPRRSTSPRRRRR